MKPWKLLDLHCDTLSECHKRGVDLRDATLHLCLDRKPEWLHMAQTTAIFIPDNLRGPEAMQYFEAVFSVYLEQLRRFPEQVTPVMDLRDIDKILDRSPVASILAVEGGAVLGGDLDNVGRLYRRGVRMMTLTWNAANEIGGGSATDLGLTDFGIAVIAEMERLGMIVDVSHLSDRSFYDVCLWAKRPFIATHSNARAVCGHTRNLTDDMFREIVRRGGLVGLNFYDNFILRDGNSLHVDDLLRHIHHFLELGGEDVLALGSDFDGADMPPYVSGVEKLPDLIGAMEWSGIPAAVVEKIRYQNARRFLAEYAGNTEAQATCNTSAPETNR